MKNFKTTERAAVAIRRITPSGKAAITGLLTLTLAFATSGCSHSKKQTANSNQNSPQNQTSQIVAPSVPVGPAPVASQPEVAKKRSVKGPVRKLPATKTYTDGNSGLSFTYPRKSTLEIGDKADNDVVVATQLPMSFVQPGGVTMAVVELPGVAKSGSAFTPAFFTVSLNKGLTAEQCSQFAEQEKADQENTESAAEEVSNISTLTIGGIEYAELDRQTENGAVKYFHRFISGSSPDESACFEFAMSVKDAQKQDADKTSASSDLEQKDAFAKLEKILASVNIKSEKKSEAVEAAKAEDTNSETIKTEWPKAQTAKEDSTNLNPQIRRALRLPY